MPGLTVAVLICLPILIGLGIWQYQRWQWKIGILDEIEVSVTAPPLRGINALERALAEDEALDLRRIQIGGEATGPTYHLYRPEGGIQWQAFRTVKNESGRTALVGFGVFEDKQKAQVDAPTLDGERAGYVRRIRPRTGFAALVGAEHSPDNNRWFAINPDGAWDPEAAVWIDLSNGARDATSLPVRRPDIPNNHVSYMLTWWSFAIILLVIYAILHKRAGRLSLS